MARLQIPTGNDWWLIWGPPSADPAEDAAFLFSGLTQTELTKEIQAATKDTWSKNPAGQWVPDTMLNMDKLITNVGKYITRWRNIVDADGRPIEFSQEALRRVLNLPGIMNTLILSISRVGETAAEIAQAQRGNSQPG